MRRICISLVLFLLLLLVNFTAAYAQQKEFKTSVTTTYTVSEQGSTTVEQAFSIENLQPGVYVKQYVVTLSDPKLSNIQVTYSGKHISPAISQEAGKTTIDISFPDDLVGQGKRRVFSLSYQTSTIALVTGNVLEMHIPVIENKETIDKHTIKLITPIVFGRATRVTPEPTLVDISEQGLVTTFENPAHESIAAFFGSDQYYALSIRYNLENKGSATGLAQVALPPDTSYQRMTYQTLEPRPYKLESDEDGNWIATYQVPASSTLTPQLTAHVHLKLDPFEEVPITQPQSFHTKSQDYWPVQDVRIKELAIAHKTTKELYDHVIKTLSYTENVQQHSLERLGAVKALERPNESVCQEYTDVFVTLNRALHVPTRRLTGIAHTQDKTLRPQSIEGDVLHAWADYYDQDKQRWIPVDPTWQDTTGGLDYFNNFDLNHIVFAINGKSSTIPYPGGSYKTDNGKSRDIELQITEPLMQEKPSIQTRIIPKKFLFVELPGFYTLEVENISGRAWYNLSITSNTDAEDQLTVQQEITALLPFQRQEIPLNFYSTNWRLQKREVPVTISIPATNDHVITQISLASIPKEISWFFDTRNNFTVAIGCGVAAITAGGLLVFRQRRQRALRRKSKKS